MRPTHRGSVAFTIAVLALVFAWTSGPRTLNAIATPILVALAIGVFSVHRTDPPIVERSKLHPGFPGDVHAVTLDIDGRGVATIDDTIGDGLSGATNFERTLPATMTYDLTYERRGVHVLGPVTVTVRDALHFVEKSYVIRNTSPVVVYPPVYSVGELDQYLERVRTERNGSMEFDHLREYVSGDPIHDIHWKTSAKHDNLLVTEFADSSHDDPVIITASSTKGHEDEMALAAATLFVAAKHRGANVELSLPTDPSGPGANEMDVHNVLETLARFTGGTDAGSISDRAWDIGDIRILADASGTHITLGDVSHEFDDLVHSRENPLAREGYL